MSARITLLALTAVVIGGVLARSAVAYRVPTSTERLGLIATTRAYMQTSACSGTMRRWAVLALQGYNRSGKALTPYAVLLRRRSLAARWKVQTFGYGDLAMPRDLAHPCA